MQAPSRLPNSGVLLLAGGRSRRFGSDKRSAILSDGRNLLDCAIANAQASGLPLLVCLRQDDISLATELRSAGINCVLCPDSDQGMGSSLANGMQLRPAAWQGVVIALADMPWIRPATLAAVAQDIAAERIVTPCYRGSRGHPVGFGSTFFPLLEELRGDTGARKVLDRFPTAIHKLAIDDPGILEDVDKPAQIVRPTRRI